MPLNQPPFLPACFAPEITEGNLLRYAELAVKAREQGMRAVADEMERLIKMIKVFLETPTSTEEPKTIRVRTTKINGKMRNDVKQVPLSRTEIARIDSVVPYEHELYKATGPLFNSITDKETLNAAKHLLWYGKELYADREPMTLEKV